MGRVDKSKPLAKYLKQKYPTLKVNEKRVKEIEKTIGDVIDFIAEKVNAKYQKKYGNTKKFVSQFLKGVYTEEIDVQKFTDPVFPPTKSSIFEGAAKDHKGMLTKDEVAVLKKTSFKRISDLKQDIKVFDKINPDDIHQGELGNCYFMSGVSALAEFPKRVEDCFITKTMNDEGKYIVRLYDDGVLKHIPLDDHFPWDGKKFNFSHCEGNKENEIWVHLLEKAWAKLCGSYAKSIAGNEYESLTALTGAPTETIYHEEVTEKQLWSKIKNADESKFVMTCGIGGGNTEEENS